MKLWTGWTVHWSEWGAIVGEFYLDEFEALSRDRTIALLERRVELARLEADAWRAAVPALAARRAGQSRSPRKAAAARENGRKGGRPRA